MIVRSLAGLVGTSRDVKGDGWNSRRLLLRQDGMGFSLHDTLVPPGAELRLWYKNHLEAVYCVAGDGSIENLATGEVHALADGVMYALDQHDRHLVRGGEQTMRMICVFNPPLSGGETHDADGSYILSKD